MGQEFSSEVSPDQPPNVLKRRDLAAVAEYIKSGKPQRVVVMLGAGASTAAGIPDFRSPGTGLYSQLARLNLPHPEAVFELEFFKEHPQPFYTLAKELYPGTYVPTYTHAFIALLAAKKLLYKCFTQNIDCLERLAGVPADLLVEAHGTFATQRCIDCKTPYDDDEMKAHVKRAEVPRCNESGCSGLVKPDIVFFGEALPKSFSQSRQFPAAADLCFVVGTSLSVQPFASLPWLCGEKCPRVLFNNDRVGGLGNRVDDVVCLGKCDDGIRELVEVLGWENDLNEIWKAAGGRPSARSDNVASEDKTTDEKHDIEVEELMKKVDASLKISDEHQKAVRDIVEKPEESPFKANTTAEERAKSISKAVAESVNKDGKILESQPVVITSKSVNSEGASIDTEEKL